MIRLMPSLILLFSIALNAGMEITPEKPREFETIEISYSASNSLGADSAIAVIYCFNEREIYPTAFEVSLGKLSSKMLKSVKFKLPDFTVFGLIKVIYFLEEGTIEDRNNEQFWQFLVHDNSMKPLKNAHLKAALSYMGNQPEYYGRFVDFNKALNHFNMEIEFYPDNVQATIGNASLKYDTQRISYDDFEETINKAISGYNPDNPAEVMAVIRALNALNESKKSDAVQSAFVEKYPDSRIAEEQALSKLSQSESFREFVQFGARFLHRFPNSENYQQVYSALSTSFMQMNKTKEFSAFMNDFPPPASVLMQLGVEILNNEKIYENLNEKKRLDTARGFIEQALEVNNDTLGLMKRKSSYLSNSEWKLDLDVENGLIYEALADIQLKSGDSLNAYNNYKNSLSMLGRLAAGNIYEKFLQLCYDLDKDGEILKLSRKAYINGIESNLIKKFLENHLKKFDRMTDAQIESEIENLKEQSRLYEAKQLSLKKLNIETQNIIFSRVNGTINQLDDYKGQVLILNAWSSWCGPCQAMFPALETLYAMYADTVDIAVASVNIWEQGESSTDAVNEVIEQYNPGFPILIDKNAIFPLVNGITGLPSTLVYDKEGKLQFQIQGFTNEDEFLEQLDMMISILREE